MNLPNRFYDARKERLSITFHIPDAATDFCWHLGGSHIAGGFEKKRE